MQVSPVGTMDAPKPRGSSSTRPVGRAILLKAREEHFIWAAAEISAIGSGFGGLGRRWFTIPHETGWKTVIWPRGWDEAVHPASVSRERSQPCLFR